MRILVLLLFTLASMAAQSGPGGVGNSASNTVWLKPENLSGYNNDDPVGSWPDASGNGRNYANGNADEQPLFKQAELNAWPTLRFDGNNDRLFNYSAESGQNNFTVFFVGQSYLSHQIDPQSNSGTVGTAGQFYILEPRHRSTEAGMGVAMAVNGISVYEHGSSYMPATAVYSGSVNGYQIVGVRYTSRRPTIFLNSTISHLGVTSGRSNVYGPQAIGRGSYGAFAGDLAELIVYNTTLNDAQRILVENYLSSKYNLAIGNNDKYSHEVLFGTDVAGIGRQTSTARHVSASSSILNLYVSSIATDGSYMLFGHNNAPASGLTTIAGDNFNNDETSTRRIAREWRLEKTGMDLGNVSLGFDISALSLADASWSWVAFIDNNGDGDFNDVGDTYADLTVAGNTASATDIELPDGATVTLGALQRRLGFLTATSQSVESNAFPAINVAINYPYSDGSEVSFDLSVNAGGDTTLIGSDFATNSSRDTLASGNSLLNLNHRAPVKYALRVFEDIEAENTETVLLQIANLQNAILADISTHVYSILDNDQSISIEFAEAAINRAEGDTDFTLSLNFSLSSDGVATETASNTSLQITAIGGNVEFGNLSEQATDAAIHDTTAAQAGTAAIDSVAVTTGLLTFNRVAGLSAVPTLISVPILRIKGDALFEADETIELSLSEPFACALGAQTEMTITLSNNDNAPTISFLASAGEVEENAGIVAIAVGLSEIAGREIEVTFSAVGGNPPAGSGDYAVISSPVTIPAGALATEIEVAISDDADLEANEEVVLTLQSSLATIVAPEVFTLSIIDDDAIGSTGPAGVGSSAINTLWLKPETLTGLTNNDPVIQWPDASGNGFHMNRQINREPSYRSNQLNGYAVVDFQPDGDNLRGDKLSNTSRESGVNNFTIFLVARGESAYSPKTEANSGVSGTSGGRYVLEPRNRGGFAGMGLSLGNNGATVFEHGSSYMPAPAVYNNSLNGYNIIDVRYTNRRPAIFVNATLVRTGLLSTKSIVYGPQALGYVDTYGPFDGQVAELIIFNTVLNEGQRLVLDNYLAAKYAINIGGNDKYAGDQIGNGSYNRDVIGIGTSDGSVANKHRQAAGSGGLVLMERNNSLAAAGEFLMAGHKTGINSLTTSDLNLESVEQRWLRSWYIDKTGSVDARISFDFSDAGQVGFPGGAAANYVLLYRPDEGEIFTAVVGLIPTIDGDQVVFNVDDTNLADGYYTLGSTNIEDSSLPVELSSFSASGADGEVLLTWVTSSESENAGFNVYRSESEAGDYLQISSYRFNPDLEGLGTSNTGQKYSYRDADAGLTNGQTYYYKLVDVDYSGNLTWHGPVSGTPLAAGEEEPIVRRFAVHQNYPNPFNPSTSIVIELKELTAQAVLEIYDISGRRIRVLHDGPLTSYNNTFVWDASNANGQRVASGVYFYRYRSATQTVMRKMVLLR
jgi:hypothetical protein